MLSVFLTGWAVQVPADFDASVLLPVDDSEKKLFIKGFLDSFLERWLVLRCEVTLRPPATFPLLI